MPTACTRPPTEGHKQFDRTYSPMLTHILYCNDNADVLVIDLPTSIARAQASTQRLRSCPARDAPYLTPEPKGAKREALLSAIPPAERQHHEEVQRNISAALGVLHKNWRAPIWYRTRALVNPCQPSTQPDCPSHQNERMVGPASPPLVLSMDLNNFCCPSVLTNNVVHNPYLSSTNFILSDEDRFIIPPRCTFLNGSVEEGLGSFERAVQCLLPRHRFDLILLDPPWSNRSVRNSRAYHSAETPPFNPFTNIFPTVITYLSDDGLVAIWVTNKAAVRLEAEELCHSHGLVLVEEWIWLKITTQGEPIYPLTGMWRSPYEMVLLFRRNTEVTKVVRRLGIAAPDIHSRKPSLKSMFEQILPPNYNALEVFARSLTAGWWSWGDEVLKFQHERNWVPVDSE